MIFFVPERRSKFNNTRKRGVLDIPHDTTSCYKKNSEVIALINLLWLISIFE